MRPFALVVGLTLAVGCSIDRGGTGVGFDDTGAPVEDTNVAVTESSIDPSDVGVPDSTALFDAIEETSVEDAGETTVDSIGDAIGDAIPDIGMPCVHFAYSGHDYWFCNKRGNWDTARTACILLGTDLAVIGGDTENAFVDSTARSLSTSDVFIGHTDSKKEGDWVSVDGKSTYTHWDTWQPDNWFGEDCAVMRGNGKWNDVDCGGDDFDWFICESK